MQNTSREFEIKLLFPNGKLKAIENFIISKGGLRRQHLQAAYIDTPDFLLTKSGVAFRIRKEGRQWVQTLKISTLNPLDRIEHNVILNSQTASLPQWSIASHQEDRAGQLLFKILPNLSIESLAIQYRTDIWRRKALINTRSGALEYALDQGMIYTNNQGTEKKELVQELEIELKEGQSTDVLRHAQIMIKRFKAYIDTVSKSERGYLLASGIIVSPPKRAQSITLKKSFDEVALIDSMLNACLSQILPNQSVLASDYERYDEHLHQLRVGLRRLKTILKYFTQYHIVLSEAGTVALSEIFSRLGEYRDGNYVSEILNPILIEHNGPPIPLKEIKGLPHPQSFIREQSFQLLLLEMMSLGVKLPTQVEGRIQTERLTSSVKKPIFKILNKTLDFSIKQASKLSNLEDDAIHTLRKKLKFLRYSLEFFKDLCIRERFKPFFKLLTSSLEHLGHFNDICVAISRIEAMTASDPRLFFALGWLKAERLRTRGLCEKSIKELFQTKPAW
jgi:inorganic triphosphatase YgiF